MIKFNDKELLNILDVYYSLGYDMNDTMSEILYSLVHDDSTIITRKSYEDKVTIYNDYEHSYELSTVVSYNLQTIACKLSCVHDDKIIYTFEFGLTRRPHEKDSTEEDKESTQTK